MNPPPNTLKGKDIKKTHQALRAESSPARGRDRLLPRVRAARRRLLSRSAG
jgi:hypothetical protein